MPSTSKLLHLIAGLLVLGPSSSWAFSTRGTAVGPGILSKTTPKAFCPRSRHGQPLFPSSSFLGSSQTQTGSVSTSTRLFQSSEVRAQEEVTSTSRDSQQLLDAIVFANASVLLFVGISVIYSLFHVNIEALLALWEYDLGEHAPELTKMGVAMELMARQPLDWLHSYEALVPTNPIFYKAYTSGVAYALGDFISQVYQGKTLKTLDLPRSLRSGAAGFIGHGPLCHYWLLFMETYLDFGGAWWATGIKVTADLTVWSIFLNAAYSFIIGTLAMRKPQDVFADVKVTLWPALRSAWRFWPFVHTISFSHAVPLDLKLLWVDVMEVVWVTILSKVANEDKNARMKANPELVQATDVSSQVPEADPALEIELTREIETSDDKKNLAFELPQKVLAACWPLIIMWPVLYAGYQLEVLLGLEV